MPPLIRTALLGLSHLATLAAGFAAGIYALPIITAPAGPTVQELQVSAEQSSFTGIFRRDLVDSDALHWGEGTLFVGPDHVSLEGSLAPGPDYRLYLSPVFLQTEAEFLQHRSAMVQVGHVKTFDNFMIDVPPGVDVQDYSSAIVWCETFGQFITAAEYRKL